MLGAYCLLCYGIAVCGPFDGFCPYVFRYGSVECTDCFLDFSRMLPWTLKPLWSPFLEMFKTKNTLLSLRKSLPDWHLHW